MRKTIALWAVVVLLLAVLLVAMFSEPVASQDGPKGTIIFEPTVGHSGPPANDCKALYRKFPKKPSKRMARHLNRFYAPCVWEGYERKQKPRPKPCTKIIEDKGKAIIVSCDHKLSEGQSE